jgi:hypothetical protein
MRKAVVAAIFCCAATAAIAVAVSFNYGAVRTTTEPSFTSAARCLPSDAACTRSSIEQDAGEGRFASAIQTLLLAESKNGCHTWGHLVGKLAAGRLTADEAFSLNSAELDVACDFGYLHGVFQGLVASGADIQRVLSLGCPVERDQWWVHECFHGVGHAFGSSGISLDRALLECRAIRREESACASGVYMEFAARYLEQDSELGMNPDSLSSAEKLTDAAAREMCFTSPKAAAPDLLDTCARKAALFWGPTTGREPLGLRCMALLRTWSGVATSGTAVECGAGIGEWLRNSVKWEVPGSPTEAASLNELVAASCTQETGSQPVEYADDLLYGCVEGAVLATLPGQIGAGIEQDSWLNPCEIPTLLPVRGRCLELIERVARQAADSVAS